MSAPHQAPPRTGAHGRSSRRAFLGGRAPPPAGPTERITIAETCLARRNIVCGICRDECPQGAIRMRPAIGRVPVPIVDAERCTGCGDCARICPAEAIVIAPDQNGGSRNVA
jgi:ferredoxin